MSTSLIEPKVASAPLDESSAPYLISPQAGGPIRAERLGPERLEAHARQLAAACVLDPRGRAGSPLLRRFAENGRFLREAHRRIFEASAGAEGEGRGLDAEWLCDNFHIIEEVLREVRQDLPHGYDEELPKLSGGPSAATRASTPWPWPWSPIPTASWTRPASSGSSGRSRKSPP